MVYRLIRLPFLAEKEAIKSYNKAQTKAACQTAEISEVSGFKALFGDPEINDTSIVTFVVRSSNASEIIGKIEKSLAEKGFESIHRMFENIGDNDGWGSVSVKTALSNEGKLMNMYEKNYKTLDKTLSIGVYRVAEK